MGSSEEIGRELTVGKGTKPRPAISFTALGSAKGRLSWGVPQTEVWGPHRTRHRDGTDAHSAKDAGDAIHLRPPSGPVGPSQAWGKSAEGAEPGLCPVFSSASGPFQPYQNLRGYFLLTGPWRCSEHRGRLGREWRRNSVLWIQYQLCDFPPKG